MKKIKFGALWIGESLPKLQYTCLSSLVYYGHDVDLYVYNDSITTPPGVNKKDASEILPESEIFLVENTYAGFSDVFRYQMINKTGKVWIDADVLCMSPDWNFKDNIFASVESVANNPDCIAGGVLSLPQNSEIINYLIEESVNFDKNKIVWGEIGPQLLDKAFKKFNYLEYAYPHKVFFGINYTQYDYMWRPDKLKDVLELEKESKSISMYNQMITRSGKDKNDFPEGSAIEYFYKKFVLGVS